MGMIVSVKGKSVKGGVCLFRFTRPVRATASDRLNFQFCEKPTMAFGFMIALAALEFEGDDFLVAILVYDLGLHLGSRQEWITHGETFAAAGSENFVESHRVSHGGIELFDINLVSLFHAVLFAARSKNCVFHRSDF